MTEAFAAKHAASYAAGVERQVPGFSSLHRMTSQLLAEHAPPRGRVLVVGAGGGLELKALADAHAGWNLVGVDPSAAMLAAAARLVAPHAERISLHEGYVDTAPEGPFDGACSLLTLHFVPRAQRLPTLREIRHRLVPGAPFVTAHISFAQEEPARSRWIARHVAYAGTTPDKIASAEEAIATRLSVVSPAEDEALLREAGFSDVALFYAGLSFRGWVGYA